MTVFVKFELTVDLERSTSITMGSQKTKHLWKNGQGENYGANEKRNLHFETVQAPESNRFSR